MTQSPSANNAAQAAWPDIPYEPWADTCATLHRWTQIVGKFRVAREPWLNHSWSSALYLNARGLTTGPVPIPGGAAEVAFDVIGHRLHATTSHGAQGGFALEPMSVALFWRRFHTLLAKIGAETKIHGAPNEIADAAPFAEDEAHASYDPDAVERFWLALLAVDQVFKTFRTGFLGKSSPSHFFWGSFDLAVTRFSGRPAPLHLGGVPALPDSVATEAYSHEVSSAGFWPGNGLGYPAFYAYAYPSPSGFGEATVSPDAAFWSTDLGEFLLPYDTVRTAPDPDATLLAFLQSTYDAAANLGGWDRPALDCAIGAPGKARPL